MKKFTALLLAVLMTATVFTGCGESDYDTRSKTTSKVNSTGGSSSQISDEVVPNAESDFQYCEISSEDNSKLAGGIAITRYIGASEEVVIPETINGKQVVAIDPLAFCPYTEDELLRIQDVENESSADAKFLDFSKVLAKLSDMEIGNIYVYWVSPGDWASDELEIYQKALAKITNISSIESVKIPASVKNLGFGVFAFCTNLKSVEIYNMPSEKPLAIECGTFPFYACGNLERVNFYPNNEGYGTDTEYIGCINLKTAYLYPDKEGYVNLYHTLYSNKNVKEIYIAEGTTIFSAFAGLGCCMTGDVVEYTSTSIIYEYGIETIHLPFTLKGIGMHSFCTDTKESLGKFIYGEEEPACNGVINKKVQIITPAGSYAEQFAKENGIPVSNE